MSTDPGDDGFEISDDDELLLDAAWGIERSAFFDAEQRSLRSRLKLRETFRPLFKDMAQRLVEAEVTAIRSDGVAKLGQRDSADFAGWLQLYHHDTLRPLAETLALPILRAYASAVERDVLDELGLTTLADDIETYAESVAGGFSETYTGKSLGQLRQVTRDAELAGVNVADALEQRLREWLDTRAGKVADGETVRSGEAFARSAYIRGGVTRFRWKTSAAARHCPYCQHLNGKVVGAQQDFVASGQGYQPEGAERPITPRHPVKHAPLHGKCDCSVVPER